MTVHTASLSEGDFLPRRNGAHHLAVAPLGVFNGEQVPILIMPSTDHQFTYAGPWGVRNWPRMHAPGATPSGWYGSRNSLLIQEWFDSMPSDKEIFRGPRRSTPAASSSRIRCGG